MTREWKHIQKTERELAQSGHALVDALAALASRTIEEAARAERDFRKTRAELVRIARSLRRPGDDVASAAKRLAHEARTGGRRLLDALR